MLGFHLLGLLFVLANALVPLFATPNPNKPDETVAAEDLNITTSHPKKGQWIEIDKQTGTKEVSATPSIKINAVGGGLELGGVGVNKQLNINESRLIYMNPTWEFYENQPSKVKWQVHFVQPINYVP